MLHSGCLERHGESTATPVQPATSVGAVDSHTAPSGFFFHDTGRSGRVEGRTRRRCAVPASVPYSPFICCVVRSAQLMFAPLRLFSPEIDVLFFFPRSRGRCFSPRSRRRRKEPRKGKRDGRSPVSDLSKWIGLRLPLFPNALRGLLKL